MEKINLRSYNEQEVNDVPIGIAKRDIKDGEYIEIKYIGNKLYSEAISFFEYSPYLSLISNKDDLEIL